MLNYLLIFVPVAIGLRFLKPDASIFIFIASCLAIIPLAGWLGKATEHLAEKTSSTVGGLLNATFGNAAELIIALMAIRAGLYEVAKASITGSIIGNILLVLGAAFVAGGLRHERQKFNPLAAHSQATLPTLAAIGLIVPAMYHYVAGPAGLSQEDDLSLEISVVLLLTYGMFLLFTLYTHQKLFIDTPTAETGTAHNHAGWSTGRSMGVLLAATAMTAWISEILVGSVEAASEAFGMSDVFVGVIVVATVGNAAEHSSAILAAWKNRMDLALGIAVGSSLQIALLVAPLLVLLSYFMGPQHMTLVFSPAEVVAIAVAVWITGQITIDSESNWIEGAMLLAVYIILAITFYFLPAQHGGRPH